MQEEAIRANPSDGFNKSEVLPNGVIVDWIEGRSRGPIGSSLGRWRFDFDPRRTMSQLGFLMLRFTELPCLRTASDISVQQPAPLVDLNNNANNAR